jgi:hypothetical protein
MTRKGGTGSHQAETLEGLQTGEWEHAKATIEDLYICRGLNLHQVQDSMKQQGFNARSAILIKLSR